MKPTRIDMLVNYPTQVDSASSQWNHVVGFGAAMVASVAVYQLALRTRAPRETEVTPNSVIDG